MNKEESPQCPVCDHTQTRFVFEAIDYTVSKEKFKIWECSKCTFRFTSPVPGEDEIGPYYKSEEYISHTNTSKGLINSLYQIVRKRTLKSKRNLMQSASGKSTGTILDIGCGTGDFLGKMKESGWETTGIEPDPGARKLAVETHKLNVLQPEQLFDLEEKKYDVITMWHVLEHVHRLKPYLKKIKSALKDDGLFLIAVPNYTSHDAKKYKEVWAAYDVPRHLYHFSPRAMSVLVEQFGFSVSQMKSMPFDSFYVAMLSEKYRNGGLLRAGWIGFWSWLSSVGNSAKCSSVIYLINKN